MKQDMKQIKFMDEPSNQQVTVQIDTKGINDGMREMFQDGQDKEFTVYSSPITGNNPTDVERKVDIDLINQWMQEQRDETLADSIIEFVKGQPRNKDGRFAKKRVRNMVNFNSYVYEDEEAYGWQVPAIRVRTVEPDMVEVVFEHYVNKY